MKLWAGLAVVALGFHAPAAAGEFPDGGPDFKTSLSAVITAAKRSGRPMVVVFSSPSCLPCQVMRQRVFPSKLVRDLQASFEWAYLDTTQPINDEAVSMFQVQTLPHIQFLDKDGQPLAQVGYTDAPHFAGVLQDVLRLSKAPPK